MRILASIIFLSSMSLVILGCAVSGGKSSAQSVLTATAPATLPEKITLQSVPMIQAPSRVPPEPDKTLNSATLVGVDSNHNGIRDDVERWIATEYTAPAERAVAAQIAKAFQATAYFGEGKIGVWDSQKLTQAATLCTYKVNPDGKTNKKYLYDRFKRIQSRTYNTRERIYAFGKEGHALAGIHLLPGENEIAAGNACEIQGNVSKWWN